MSLEIRPATKDDTLAMASLINRIIEIGGTTAYRDPFDPQKIQSEFMKPDFGISCFVAVEDGKVCGFQVLEWCDPNWKGGHVLPADWAVIATFVDPSIQTKGIGSRLFEQTLAKAKEVGALYIDATIRKENSGGLTYYDRMGFVDYRSDEERISKRLAPSSV